MATGTSQRPPSVLLLAGETSGDLHGARLAGALKARIPGVRLVGLGGPEMAREGVELLEGLDRLAVMGFAEVVRHMPFFLGLERRIKALMASGEIDLVLPIDYPGFNLRMTRAAHGMGLPVLYYIAPQVWAWKAGRTRILAECADEVAVILPFEVEFLRSRGVQADFVGHPLIEALDELELPSREAFCAPVGLDPDRPILALFPGSRGQELARHLDVFVAAARLLVQRVPGLQPVLARAGGMDREQLAVHGFPVVDEGRVLLRHARGALVKSGTTTLEAALAGPPFVVAYRTHPVTFRMAQHLVKIPHVALANLVAEERVVPELLQDDVTPDRLADALEPLLRDGPDRDRVMTGLAGVRAKLGEFGASERVAEIAGTMLEERRGGSHG